MGSGRSPQRSRRALCFRGVTEAAVEKVDAALKILSDSGRVPTRSIDTVPMAWVPSNIPCPKPVVIDLVLVVAAAVSAVRRSEYDPLLGQTLLLWLGTTRLIVCS